MTVPGAVDGWDKLLRRFGHKSLSDVLAPAIRYADEGFPVTEIFSSYWVDSERKLSARYQRLPHFSSARPCSAAGRDISQSGSRVVAQANRRAGPKAFYRGEIAKRILATSQQLGGKMRRGGSRKVLKRVGRADLHPYHGWNVYELPPNGQGIGALMMLNIMERFPLGRVWPRVGQRVPCDDRGQETGLC